MQFLEDNMVSIIIIGVILLLALIGYIADKNGFGSNKPVKKKSNEKDGIEPNVEEEVPQEEVNFEEEVPQEEVNFEEETPIENKEKSDEIDFENEDNNELTFDDNQLEENLEGLPEEGNEVDIEPVESEKEETNEEEKEEPVELEEASFDTIPENGPEDISSELEEKEEPTDENMNFSSDEVESENDALDFSNENIESKDDTIDFSNDDLVEANDDKEKTTVSDNIDEDLYAPFGDQEFNKEEKLNIDNDFNKIMNDVDETTKNANNTSDEEDIWKF